MVIQAEVHHLLIEEVVEEELVVLASQLLHHLALQVVALDLNGHIQEIPMLVVAVVAEVPRIQAVLVALVVAELVAVLPA
jgi:hypothetical protein